MINYRVRVKISDDPTYLTRNERGLPVFTSELPVPLSLGWAEILRRDGSKCCANDLVLEEANND